MKYNDWRNARLKELERDIVFLRVVLKIKEHEFNILSSEKNIESKYEVP